MDDSSFNNNDFTASGLGTVLMTIKFKETHIQVIGEYIMAGGGIFQVTQDL